MLRRCKKCCTEKALQDFYKHSRGYRHECKLCVKERSAVWAKENKEARATIVRNSRARTRVWREYSNSWKRANGQNWKRRSRLKKSTPHWLDSEQVWMISEIYSLCSLRTQITGVPHHVDHIVPLNGNTVCGLNVPWNLQVLTAKDNFKKSNKLI